MVIVMKVVVYLAAFSLVFPSSYSGKCKPNQKRRRDAQNNEICCFTVKCIPGQRFKLCYEDQCHDTCQDCPVGFTHYDDINTADLSSEFDPCEEKFECDYSDLKIINGVCSCDRTNGYYGYDINLCKIDDGSCMKAGYELAVNGECRKCDVHHFKPAEDSYGLCIAKTRCADDQEVADPGSESTDRTCRTKKDHPYAPQGPDARNTKDGPITVSSSVSTTRNPFDNSKKNLDKKNPEEEKPDDQQNFPWYIPVLGLTVIVIIILIISICKRSDDGSRCIYSVYCCSGTSHNNTTNNFNANNVIFGNGNSIKAGQIDSDDDSSEEFLEEV